MFNQVDGEHCSNFRVYSEDTDFMGIVFHANYLNFFERARTEMLRDHGCSLMSLAEKGIYFAIHDVHLRYIYPARLDDNLTIKTSCIKKQSCSLFFRQLMYNQQNQMLSEATVQVVCVNKILKPKRLPEEFI